MSQEKSIIDKINESAPDLTEEDLNEWVVPNLLNHYSPKLKSLAYFVYGPVVNSDGSPSLGLLSFTEEAKIELTKGLCTFLFTSEHWRSGRDVNSYLLTCLNRLSDRLKLGLDSAKRVSIPVCPACKTLGNREFMSYESKLLRCAVCTSEVERLEYDLKTINDSERAAVESKIRLHKIFALHTRRGYRCPDCERFIPASYLKSYGFSCAYEDCTWFGTKSELDPMAHPLGLSSQQFLSLNTSPDENAKQNYTWIDNVKSNIINPDDALATRQQYAQEYVTLKNVIDIQMKRAKANGSSVRSLQKVLMYQTYANMLEKYPDDMVSYLVHMKHSSGSPIQSRIFQEYIRQVENHLPFSIFKGGKEIEIYSLQDPNLNLFLGISEFDAEVKRDHSIPNNTKEMYIGGRKLKNYGPCFIGMVIGVTDEDGNSLMNAVEGYTFVKIMMNDTVPAGTKVKVTHFRTHSHYEMGGLVPLQRVRRKIVDSTYKRLNGSAREVQRNVQNQKD